YERRVRTRRCYLSCFLSALAVQCGFDSIRLLHFFSISYFLLLRNRQQPTGGRMPAALLPAALMHKIRYNICCDMSISIYFNTFVS
ncbi:MAG: hypothetical protein FWE67_13130, partial [Planctomycetaceae bacterium]|nr:hypothetical protein [Planctomycetaceae bacterium]